MARTGESMFGSEQPSLLRRRWGRSLQRLAILLGGIILGQALLYGPSLIGKKILLPLDLLAMPDMYLPATPDTEKMEPHDRCRSDLVLQWEPARQFAVAEFQARRFPMWTPDQYAGAPFVWPKFSPFLMLECCTASPVILAWAQLFAAVVAGIGAYLFFRRALAVHFWAAVIPAWCYPLTGFFVFWQGFPTNGAVYWLPWLLLMVDRAIRRTSPRAVTGASLVTGLALTSGALDVAGQVVLVSGLYAAWCWWDAYPGRWFQRPARWALSATATGCLLGFLLAAPYWLPLVEYAHTGVRMVQRAAGREERPPVGLTALPQTVLPDMYGAMRTGSLYLMNGNQSESAAAAYAGLLATLFVAPLAWCSRRHRSSNLFWSLLIFFSLSWCLNVPGLVALLRLPGLNMMSHNRLVFAASFAILAMTAVGLDVLWLGGIRRRGWFWFPVVVLAGLYAWCFYRAINLPEPLATQIQQTLAQGKHVSWIRNPDDLERVQAWFTRTYTMGVVLCGLGLLGWLLLWLRQTWPRWAVPALGFLLLADLLWFAHDRSAQCDPALYYPPLPVLEQVARSAPGRIMGYHCLPPALAQTQGLRDIRGYDAVDPACLMDLIMPTANPVSGFNPYALTQWLLPRFQFSPPDGIRLSPILDMLNVRYVIFRGVTPPPPEIRPVFQGQDYWVVVNHTALPRVFLPRQVETVPDDRSLLEKLASPQFNPREVAYVKESVSLPASCRGMVEIVDEVPTRIKVAVRMETSGLVVLADLWDQGWHAYLDGKPVPILRANHAIRGVIVPPGKATLEFRYQPASFRLGLWLAGLAGLLLIAFVWMQARKMAETT